MSAETDFYALLSGSAGVTALVGTRIYPDVLPEDCIYPAIVYARSGTDPERLLDGSVAVTRIELACAAWAETRVSADAVADAVEAALLGGGFATLSRVAAADPETGLLAAQLNVDIFV